MLVNKVKHSSGPAVGRVIQVVAALTAIAITLPVIMYAYGYSMTQLEQYFSFGAGDVAAKTLLGVAMIIMIFFARPRSGYLRAFLAIASSIVLIYAVQNAVTQSLMLGDTLTYLVGTLIGITETLEAKLPNRSIRPASSLHQSPTAKP